MQSDDLEKTPFYHFSVDDVFKSLIEITDNNLKVFQHPFFAFLKELHDEFGVGVDLYLFFQKEIDGKLRTLREVSASLKQEFENNPWIRFGPHGLDFYTPPYTQTPEEQTRVFDDIYNEIYRFAGEKNISKWVRLHVFSESYELKDYFHAKGVEALFTTDKERMTTRMPSINDSLRETGFAEYNGLKFIRTHIRTENLANRMVRKEELERIIDLHIKEHNHICFLTHEYELFRDEVKSIAKELIRCLHNKKIPNKIQFNKFYNPGLPAKNMQAVILAAGMGKRLMPLTKEIPKSLVEVGGIPMLIRNLDNLSRLGTISEVLIVIGYKGEKIRELLGNEYKGMKITYIEQDILENKSTTYALWRARDYIKCDFILLESDLLFTFDVLQKLIEKRRDTAIVSKYEDWMDGTVVLLDNKEELIKRFIPKEQMDSNTRSQLLYKTVNIYFFTENFFKEFFKPNLEFYVSTTGGNNFYELVLGTLVYMGVPIFSQIIENYSWFEVDDMNDLDVANDLFTKDKIKTMERIHDRYGGYWRYNFLDFCYLYNNYFPTQNFYKRINFRLPELIGNYPSRPEKVAALLSRWYKEEDFNKDNIIVGNGASELIRVINKNIVNKITIPVPTFNEYFSGINEAQINFLNLKKENNFNIIPEEFINSVKESQSDFALIINPNNPTGNALTNQEIEKILLNLPEVKIIVDESFIDFTNDRDKYSVQKLIGKYPNLVVLRSISKEFGVPGLRIGYLLTLNEEIKQKVREFMPIWGINSIAEIFIEFFVKYEKEYKTSIKKTIEDREILTNSLKEINFLEPLPSFTNFLLCRVKGMKSSKLNEILFSKYNIMLHDCTNKNNLESGDYVRISVRNREDNEKLISALREIRNLMIY